VANPSRGRILVVEDELSIRELLRLHLSLAGYEVDERDNGSAALDYARVERFDLLLLDLMLPDLDGVTVCRAVRSGDGPNRHTPILMLTARDTESDKVLGLESGADDYLTKPFGIRELLARVAAMLRRHHGLDSRAEPGEARLLTSRDLRIDLAKRELLVRGERVEMTRQEFDLMVLLVSHRGIVFSRAALLAKVWSGDDYVTERTVDAVVSRIRRKIERDPQDPELILTAWGAGYKFADAD
jgi:DNA-binding response OmpR family regulator